MCSVQGLKKKRNIYLCVWGESREGRREGEEEHDFFYRAFYVMVYRCRKARGQFWEVNSSYCVGP